jgi:FtsP/CotA-like multicopper oxidase with cupredoxin domain
MHKLGIATLLAVTQAFGPFGELEVPIVVPNDNRVSAGIIRGDTLTVRLEAKLGGWRPDLEVDSAVTVPAFSEEGGAPRIPGPLLRATEGMHVVATVRNSLGDSLKIHGLRGGPFASDTVTLQPGEARELRFTAGSPGTYLYWGSTTGSRLGDRNLRDSQLTGAMIVDAAGAPRDTAERLFVITVIDIYKSDTIRNKKGEEIWETAVNGLSWPHTERFEYAVGTKVRWRWLNGSDRFHPMHLHGFHFRVLGTGAANRYTSFPEAEQPSVVTQLMLAGQSFAMEWTPTRAGRWLMHCHMTPHITPYPERPDSMQRHDVHDVEKHAIAGMAGLVLGITTRDTGVAPVLAGTAGGRRLRLFAQRARAGGQNVAQGFVLQRGREPARDSVEVPGSPLILTRGERTVITVVNRLPRPTSVHWHGMELESVYDGVAGWSRTSGSIAPLLAPGDSFTVAFTPPRAGTYIYHTHMDEGTQLMSGMYGPMLVMEPGQKHDPRKDLLFTVGGAVVNDTAGPALNGARTAPPLELSLDQTYRLRFINVDFVEIARVTLTKDTLPVTWRAIAKDGADLPPVLVKDMPADFRFGVGETYDFELRPRARGDMVLTVRIHGMDLVRVLRVR